MSSAFGGYRCLRAFLLASTAMVMLPGVQGAQAQQPAVTQGSTVNFNIPAQSLTSALTAFARQSGVQLAYPASLTAGKTAPALQGSLARDAALSRLLSGSGLTFSFTGANTATISGPGADGVAATVDGAIPLDTIDVSGGSSGTAAADLPYQTAGSTAYVSAEQISRVPPSSVADIFKGVPGVLSAQGRNGAALDVNIRGMQGMNRVKTTVDGAEQSTSTYRGYFGVDNRTYVDQDFISGVEITKGPGGSAASAGANGGVVAIKTLTPDDILLPDANYGIRLKGSRNSNSIDPVIGMQPNDSRTEPTNLFDAYGGSGSIAAAARNDNVEIVAAYSRRLNGNYFTGTKGPTHYDHPAQSFPREYSYVGPGLEAFNTSEDVESGLIKGTFKLGAHSLQLGYIYYDNHYGEITPTIAQTGGQRILSHTNVKNQTAKYRYNPLESDLIDFQFNLWRTETFEVANYFSLFSYLRVPTQSEMYGGDVSNTSRFNTGVGAFKLKYGSSLSFEDSDIPSGVTSSPQTLIGQRQIGGAYINGEWKALDWLQFNVGGRYDFYEVNSAQGDREGGKFSPSAGIVLSPWDGIQLFSTYAEGIRPATIRETTRGVGNTQFNANLDPERSKAFEVGINVDKRDTLIPNDAFRLKLAYFNTVVDDYIYRDTPPDGGVYDFWAVNLDKAKFSGAELQLAYDARRLFIELGVTYYDNIEFCRVGEPCRAEDLYRPINRIWDYSSNHVPPEFMATATLGMRFFDEALTVGTRVTYANERKIGPSPIDVSTAVVWAPFTILDMFGSYKFNDRVVLNVSAENLTDKFYIDPLGGTPIAAPGRTIRTGLTMKF